MDNNRKGQIEILGLLLIILLFAIGVLFALYFTLSGSSDGSGQEVRESILAESTLATLRKTTTNCYKNTIEELLSDCARTAGNLRCPDGSSSCQTADHLLDEISTTVFTELNRDYSLRVKDIAYFQDITYGLKQCPGAYESDEQYFSASIGYTIPIKLSICR